MAKAGDTVALAAWSDMATGQPQATSVRESVSKFSETLEALSASAQRLLRLRSRDKDERSCLFYYDS